LSASDAKSQVSQDVQFAIDAIYSLCVGGGRTGALDVSGQGQASDSLSLKKIDATGRIQGQATISRSEAQGLVTGLDNRLSSVTADQANQVRNCIAPYRERIMNLILGGPQQRGIIDPQLNRLVAQLNSDQSTARMDAYDRIIAQFKTDPNTVSALLDYAARNTQHANGIYNTVVTLRGLSPAVTRPRKAEINQYCD